MRPMNQQPVKGPFDPLSRMISIERFSTYMTAAGHDEARALQFYVWNAELGEAFHTPIQAVEVGLRNSVNHALQSVYGPDWWQDKRLLGILDGDRRSDLDLVKRRIHNRKLKLGTGQVVAGLSFGFWVGMLQPRYNPPIWGGQLRAAFPHLPANETRGSVAGKAHEIAYLRNRISHHEPIIKRNVSADFKNLMTLLKWMCPATHDWIRPYCRVPDVMRRKP